MTSASLRLGDVEAFVREPVAALRQRSDSSSSSRTYLGRVRHFMSATDPRLLFVSRAQLDASAALLRRVEQREHGWRDVLVADYALAQRRVSATRHPETGAPVPWPFRLAAFVPVNFVVLCGMLSPSQQTPLRAMGWQVANQTYNVGFNYCNGSGADGLSHSRLLLSYVVATSTACALSYTLGKRAAAAAAAAATAAKQCGRSGVTTLSSLSSLYRLLVPYFAVAGASLANLAVVRLRDCTRGIAVADAATGDVLCDGAPSPRAGRLAVAQVALSRVLVPVPLMLLPPLLLHALFDAPRSPRALVARRAALYVPANVAILVAVLQLALPLSVAVFPQQTVVSTRWLEPRYRNLHRRSPHTRRADDNDDNNNDNTSAAAAADEAGDVVTHVTFNKGI